MIVLGIDPGFRSLGWCIFSASEGGMIVTAGIFGTKPVPKEDRERLKMSKVEDHLRRLDEVSAFLDNTIETYRVALVAHESISLGFHQPLTLVEMGLAWGAVAGVAAAKRCARVQIEPRRIKDWTRQQRGLPPRKAVEKGEVIEAVKARYPNIVWPRAETIHEHLADAVVCAVLGVQRDVP